MGPLVLVGSGAVVGASVGTVVRPSVEVLVLGVGETVLVVCRGRFVVVR